MQQASNLPLLHLNGHNYMSWAFKMEMYLRRESVWQIVCNPPAQLDEEDKAKDERALSTIILCLDDSQLNYVRGKSSSKELWEALKAVLCETNSWIQDVNRT